MGVLADRLDGMRVRATSPDGRITGELHHRTEVDLAFAGGAYPTYSEWALESQLAGLARLLWTARTRRYFAAVSEAFGETVTGERRPIGRRDIAYHAARAELVATGRSGDGRIRIAVRGMRDWTVEIRAGTVRALAEEAFAAGAREASRELISDQFAGIRRLKQRIYG